MKRVTSNWSDTHADYIGSRERRLYGDTPIVTTAEPLGMGELSAHIQAKFFSINVTFWMQHLVSYDVRLLHWLARKRKNKMLSEL